MSVLLASQRKSILGHSCQQSTHKGATCCTESSSIMQCASSRQQLAASCSYSPCSMPLVSLRTRGSRASAHRRGGCPPFLPRCTPTGQEPCVQAHAPARSQRCRESRTTPSDWSIRGSEQERAGWPPWDRAHVSTFRALCPVPQVPRRSLQQLPVTPP